MTAERAYVYNGYRIAVVAVEADEGYEGVAKVFESGAALRRGDAPVHTLRSKGSIAVDAIEAAELKARTWVDGPMTAAIYARRLIETNLDPSRANRSG